LPPQNPTAKERVFKTLWSMKNDGYCETTIYATSRRLRMIARDTDIDNPDKVKEYIAQKATSSGYKENLADIYDRYVHYNGLSWQRPYYIRESQTPYVPTEEEISILINSSTRTYALVLSILRDTGMRPIELERTRLIWIDFERGAINVQTAKGGQGRTAVEASNSSDAEGVREQTPTRLEQPIVRNRCLHETTVFNPKENGIDQVAATRTVEDQPVQFPTLFRHNDLSQNEGHSVHSTAVGTPKHKEHTGLHAPDPIRFRRLRVQSRHHRQRGLQPSRRRL